MDVLCVLGACDVQQDYLSRFPDLEILVRVHVTWRWSCFCRGGQGRKREFVGLALDCE